MTLEQWMRTVSTELGLDVADPGAVQDVVLDLARDAAHGVARPAAPLTTFLLGVAVGRGADPAQAAAQIVALIPPGD